VSTVPATRAGRLSPFAGLLVAGAVIVTAGIWLSRQPPSPALAVAAAGGLACVVALALARTELVVALGFLLLGVVRFEPAPSDALLAVVIALAIAGGRLDLRRVPGAMLACVALLLALNVASLAVAVDLGVAGRFFAITLYLALLGVWATTYLQTRDRVRIAVGAYVAGAVLFATLAVLGLFVAYPLRDVLAGEDAVRAQGLFKDPNVFAPFLVPAALILLEEALRPRLLGLPRALSAAGFAVLVLGVLFAYSRAAWLNLAVALLVLALVLGVRRGTARAAAGAVALVLLVGAGAAALVLLTGSAELLDERARVQAYDTARFGAQRAGLEFAAAHPVGVGPGQFELVQPVSAHSVYVRVLAEQGVLGLGAILALLGGTLALALANVVAGRDTHGVGSAALLGAWCGILVNSAFVDTLHWRHLWIVAALVWVAAARR
jgi:O-antigen ligase